MAQDISVSISKKEIYESLRRVFKEEFVDNLSECIMDVLDDNEQALQSLFKCSIGIIPTLDFKVGEKIIVKVTGISNDYNFDKTKMTEAGMIKDACMIVTVSKIRKFAQHPYIVDYIYLSSSEGVRKQSSSPISSYYIVGPALDVIPVETKTVSPKEDDDLPF